MFHTGDRVLVLISYGEQVARVVIDGARYRVSTLFQFCLPDVFFADERELRYPMDAATDEPMKQPGLLVTSRPAWKELPLFWPDVVRRSDEPDR